MTKFKINCVFVEVYRRVSFCLLPSALCPWYLLHSVKICNAMNVTLSLSAGPGVEGAEGGGA
jgi:hypothetical protein